MINTVNAADAYTSARRVTGPSGSVGPGLANAAEAFEQVMAQADSAATGAMQGTTATHQLVESIAESKLALEAVVSIRDKVVEAYQEILRMPV